MLSTCLLTARSATDDVLTNVATRLENVTVVGRRRQFAVDVNTDEAQRSVTATAGRELLVNLKMS